MPSKTFPERVGKFAMGGLHIGTGGDRCLLANRLSEGSRATRRALDDPSRENIARYLRVHIDDESLVIDELVDRSTGAHAPAFGRPVLLINGRYDPDGAVRGLDRDPQ
jgi:hypothetical protein